MNGRINLEDMLLGMAENLYDNETCSNVKDTKIMIERARSLVEIADTLNSMQDAKLRAVDIQMKYNIRLEGDKIKKLEEIPSRGFTKEGLPYEE